jgi:hypothetical protein
MMALAAMAVANAAILLGAHELMVRVNLGRFSLNLLAFLLFRLTLVSGVVLLALCAQHFTPAALGAAGAVALAGLLAAGAHRRLSRWRDPGAGVLILAFFGLVAARLVAQAWLFAPYVPDVLSYHLPKVAEWVRSGGLTRQVGGDTRSWFPAGFELVEAWWVVFLHHDVLIEMAGIEFLALGAVAVGALARLLGLAPRPAALAALIYALAPAVHLQATACLNDAPIASLYAAAAALILARAGWPLVLLTGGAALGVKPTFVYLMPGLGLLAWLVRARPALPAAAPRILAAAALLGVLLGGFWFARNAFVRGNPVYPMTSRGILDQNGNVLVPSSPSVEQLSTNFSLLARRLDDRVGPYSAQQRSMVGWGVGPLALGLPALLLLLRCEPSFRPIAAASVLSLVCLFAFIAQDPYTMRFAMFAVAPLSIAAARMAERSAVIGALAVLAIVIQFLGTFASNEIPQEGIGDWARTPWRDRRAGFLPAISLPAAVGVYRGERSRAYLLYGPDLNRRVVYLDSPDLPSLKDELRREGITLFTAVDSPPVIRQGEAEGTFIRDVGSFYRVASPPPKQD